MNSLKGLLQPMVIVVVMALISCGRSSNTSMPQEAVETVDLFSDQIDDERETVMISAADQSVPQYQISPASFDTVIVRSAPAAAGGGPRHVEALLKGAFPDGCTELHEIDRQQMQDGESVELTMRRPEAAMCTQVVRPYRFFFQLQEDYQPGTYTLVVNDRSFSFNVE